MLQHDNIIVHDGTILLNIVGGYPAGAFAGVNNFIIPSHFLLLLFFLLRFFFIAFFSARRRTVSVLIPTTGKRIVVQGVRLLPLSV